MRYTTPNLEFDAESHEYHLDGEKLIGVTTVTGAFYNGPRASESRLAQAATRGSIIHKLTEHDDLGTGPPLHQGAQYAGERAAWQHWRQTRGFTPTQVEVKLASKAWKTAGTCDRIGILNEKPYNGILAVVDLKTGAVPDLCAAQLAAYRLMASEHGLCDHDSPIIAVAVREDGSWWDVAYRGPQPDALWRAAWTLYHWRPPSHRNAPSGDGYTTRDEDRAEAR